VQADALLGAALTVKVNMTVDLVRALLDPRRGEPA